MGKPVLATDTGEKLGTVSDLLLDDAGQGIVALVIGHGTFRGEHVLPASAIHTLGGDAVMSRSRELIDAREWRDRYADGPHDRGHPLRSTG